MRIRTTHVGSLPGPATFNPADLHDEEAVRSAVHWIVDQQRALGLDIINEGELTKGGDWLSFVDARLGGFEERPIPAGGSIITKGRDPEAVEALERQIEHESTALFSTGQLWDDGIIDPRDTRRVLALGLAAAANAPVPETTFGVFRM